MKKLGVVVASVVGACAIHFVLAACGSSAGGGAGAGSGSGTPDAFAQGLPATTACAKWHVAQYYVPDVLTYTGSASSTPPGLTADTAMPDGWEPLAGQPWGGSNANNVYTAGVLVFARKCEQ